MQRRNQLVNSSDIAEITLMSPETFSSFVPNGLYDGSDEQERVQLEAVVSEHYREPEIDICNALPATCAKT